MNQALYAHMNKKRKMKKKKNFKNHKLLSFTGDCHFPEFIQAVVHSWNNFLSPFTQSVLGHF
jgi:hypothetical protein